MKKIKLTERELTRLIEKVIKEQKEKQGDYNKTTDPTVTKALKAKTGPSRTALVVYHAQQIAKLAEKQPAGGLTEKGIGRLPEFKDSVNVIKKHIKFI